MEQKADPSLFVNDGSFMERFRQLQQAKEAEAVASNEPKSTVSAGPSTHVKPTIIANKRPWEIKANDGKKLSPASSNGKLDFSLKQKSKVVTPTVNLGEDDEEERGEPRTGSSNESAKRQKLRASDVSQPSLQQEGVGNYYLFCFCFCSLRLNVAGLLFIWEIAHFFRILETF